MVPSVEPLSPGQKVELGIAEKSLLGSALLVYMSPLAGLFLFAVLFQVLFGSDLAALSGAVLGGVGGFLLARGYSRKLAERDTWQPVILSVALPSELVRVETTSIETRQ
ncbi:Sigma factor RpoE regulatory protein RseC [Salmonella bongori]|nr:Sigma factor RpoE regulatory protein RseC [Salmonella bongori]